MGSTRLSPSRPLSLCTARVLGRGVLVVGLVLGLGLGACDDEGDRAMEAGRLGEQLAPVTGNVCPNGTTSFGIDVSKWQGTIDWAKVKGAGVKYAFIRVSDGANTADTKFASNWAGAKANGILRGAYQFFRPGQNALTQANVLLDAIAAQGASDLPPVLDVEATDGQSAATVRSKIGQWIERVESVLGVKPIIYAAPYFWESNVNSAAWASYPLWVAHWTAGCPTIPSQWADWTFHQYSDSGSVNGIAGAVDLDRFNGTLAELQALGGATGPGPATAPSLTITVATEPPAGRPRDFRPEGSSAGHLDLYEGETFTADVLIKNAADAAVADDVHIGIWFESPWLVPVDYVIQTDYPKKDGATWVVNDANANAQNPSHASPPASGKYFLYAMSPGETKRVRFTVRAAAYSLGAVDHPDVRAWVWHVPNWYGEQVAWNDPVEHNDAGGFLQSYVQHDVYARDRWTFEAPTAAETEGWSVGNALQPLTVDLASHALVLAANGADPYAYSGPAAIDAAQRRGLTLRAKTSGGPQLSRLYFVTAADATWNEQKAVSFVTPGDGAFHDLSVDLRGVPGWSGTVTQLRLDPSLGASEPYLLAELVSVASVAETSGDADGDGAFGGPGADCDDADPAIGPDASERCNGVDDDCDGARDEGFPVGEACSAGTGSCAVAGFTVCSDDGLATRCGAEVDPACGPSCLPGARDACRLEGDPSCEDGVRTCSPTGTWGACARAPSCDPTEPTEPAEQGPEAPVEGAVAEVGGASDTGALGDVARPQALSGTAGDGCQGGGAHGGLLAALALVVIGLARRRKALLCAAAVVTASACGDEAASVPDTSVTPDIVTGFDVVFVDTGADSQIIDFDSAVPTDTSRPDTSVRDVTPELPAGTDPWGFDCDDAGGEGCPCGAGAPCAGALACTETALGPTCLEPCAATCTGDRRCADVAAGGGARACVAAWTLICAPCDTNLDCREVGSVCVDFGFDGSFCAPPCAAASACPAGYTCEALGPQSQTVCVPSDDQCGCGAIPSALGMQTTCEASDGSGCTGRRRCDAGTLSACDAGDPQPELCNGQDDDCNGDTDEGCDGDGDGWCRGEPGPGVTSPACAKGFGDCDDGASGVHPGGDESCNDQDDDCDGVTDGLTRGCSGACGAGSETCSGGTWGSCSAAGQKCDAADPCCQVGGCAFEPATVRCEAAPVATEQRCDGSCGGTVEARSRFRYCTGTAAGCGDGNLQWTAWADQTTCGSNLCVASGTSASCQDCPLGCAGGQCVTQATTIVCIDPSYGPGDGPAFGAGAGAILGRDLTWSVAQHLKTWLEQDTAALGGGGSWSVVLTRTTATNPTMAERKATCDGANAQRVLSIAINGFDGNVRGSETYRKATADVLWTTFASQVHAQVIAKGGFPDRGVKVGTWPIVDTVAPSARTFLGFLDNASDRAKLSDDAWRKEVAKGLMHALQQSLGQAVFTP